MVQCISKACIVSSFQFKLILYNIYSYSEAAAHAAPLSVSEVHSLVSGCGWLSTMI